jgi:hypothetical protein
MHNLNPVIGNPRLKQHLIVYIGLKHMHRFAQHYPVMDSVPEPSLQGHYYASLRDGAFDDFKTALHEEIGLQATDSDFQPVLQAAIQVLVSSLGMETIIRDTRDVLWHMEGHDSSTQPPDPYYPDAALCTCSVCGSSRIPLGPEDLSEGLVRAYLDLGSEVELSWFCLRCRSISNE